jgi:uncharacterized protein YwgA
MTTLDQSALILQLAISLKENGSWAGETHVQKAGYFLSALMSVPLGVDFILYKHGPFSFGLRELLTNMEAMGFIRWKSMPPYGPSIVEGDLGSPLRTQFPTLREKYVSQIEFVAEQLGSRNVANLERVATALYVTKEGYIGSSRVGRLVSLKPHVDVVLAEKAVQEFDEISAKASNLRLIVQ